MAAKRAAGLLVDHHPRLRFYNIHNNNTTQNIYYDDDVCVVEFNLMTALIIMNILRRTLR